MRIDELLAILRAFLGAEDTIDAETPLISSGLIDSFGVVGLLVELESHYGLAIDPEEIDGTTFDTPRQMLEMLARKSVSVSG